jgi:hypothetical protein
LLTIAHDRRRLSRTRNQLSPITHQFNGFLVGSLLAAPASAKIETLLGAGCTTIRLIGRLSAESLPLVKAEVDAAGSHVVLEMKDVTLIDMVVIRFLIECQARGIELRGCSLYISGWIAREQKKTCNGDP